MMRLNPVNRLFPILGTWLLVLLAAGLVAAENPVKMTAVARLDLTASAEVGTLDEGAVLAGGGSLARMNWLPAAKQSAGYTAEFPVTYFAKTTARYRFKPTKSGAVTLSLMGPWEPSPSGALFKQQARYHELQVAGAKLVESADFPLTAWHDARRDLTLRVLAGRPVTIEVTASAVTPPDFEAMPRLGSKTPAHGLAQHFRQGVNFGNWLEVPPNQDWGAKYELKDVERVAQEGFDHIRLPVGWHHYTGPAPAFRIDPKMFAKVDRIADLATQHDLGLIINIHHFDEFTKNPQREEAKLLAIWEQLAAHYQQRGENIAFEILNEPFEQATTEVMNGVYAKVVPLIRQSNPRRAIFVAPGRWNQASELAALRLPADDRLIVAVHCYQPFNFTHQGATWSGQMQDFTGIEFPGPPAKPRRLPPTARVPDYLREWLARYNTLPAEQNPSSPRAFRVELQLARQWSDYFGRPIHVGEFGAYTKADQASRVNYYREFRQACEEYDLGWAFWDWKAGFRYWDPEKNAPLPGMRQALLGKD